MTVSQRVKFTCALTAIVTSGAIGLKYVQKSFAEESDRLIFEPRATDTSGPPDGVTPPPPSGETVCPDKRPDVTALVPDIDNIISNFLQGDELGNQLYLANTTETHPTFWFYVPYESNLELLAQFSLQDDQGRQFYTDTYPLASTPGIVRISLPQESPGLEEIEREYYWEFSIICNPERSDLDITVRGKVKRVALNLNLPLDPDSKALLYAKEGLLYETLTTIIEEIYPQDREQAIRRLRQLFQPNDNLDGSFADQPITTCCTPQE